VYILSSRYGSDRVTFVYEGYRVKVKVTVPRKVLNRYSRNGCIRVRTDIKNSIDDNSASITHRAEKRACSIGFSPTSDRMVCISSLIIKLFTYLILMCWLFSFQLLVVDLVDIGVMDASEATGRSRLNDTLRQLSDVISAGIVVDIGTTSGPHNLTVTSLRRCDADVSGCSNASVVAEPLTRRPEQRPRAVMTSSMTSSLSSCRTVAELVCLCFLSLFLNRNRFAVDVATLSTVSDSRSELVRVGALVRRTGVLQSVR